MDVTTMAAIEEVGQAPARTRLKKKKTARADTQGEGEEGTSRRDTVESEPGEQEATSVEVEPSDSDREGPRRRRRDTGSAMVEALTAQVTQLIEMNKELTRRQEAWLNQATLDGTSTQKRGECRLHEECPETGCLGNEGQEEHRSLHHGIRDLLRSLGLSGG